MIKKMITKIIGDPNDKELKKKRKIVEEINALEEEYQKLSEKDLKAKTEEFKERLEKGETVDDIKVEAFAVVKNACRRLVGTKFQVGKEQKEWNMIPYDVQLIGGLVLHEGKIAEMKTGEGKTLVATLPLYLNALNGKGAHCITVNDYLAKRDAEWNTVLFEYLGLTTAYIIHGLNPDERREAYSADITYGTNNEFGFDYLRDNMATKLENRVQRELHYSIVDEVDSILIDEARTPLIISAPAEESTKKYFEYSQLINRLKAEEHFVIDEKAKTATLTEEGISEMENLLGVDNIYTEAGFMEVHHIEQALKAHAIFKRDTDYVIKEGEVIIVDEFTGRLMPGRRYSDGLHQAIEAKENVDVKRESKTLATITFQNYFRLYDKLAGMTGTAKTEEEEFFRIYGLETVVIPTNKPIARDDRADMVFKNHRGKVMAITKAIKELNEKGQPVLVGTISVEKSEQLSKALKDAKIKHEVLNAKHHEREAEIVADAGQKGAVTIATNMAGRGTDIKLGEGVEELGGLAIIGTERHESRRIDNQLRGRSGRQGDNGQSTFFVSMDDDLMRLFGSDRIKGMMDKLGIEDDMPIENRLITRSIEHAQKRVEGHHFDIRKHILEYDDVMNKHREIIYARRLKVLESDNVKEDLLDLMKKEAHHMVALHTDNLDRIDWNLQAIVKDVNALLPKEADRIDEADLDKFHDRDDMADYVANVMFTEHRNKEKSLPEEQILRDVERSIMLRVIDTLWMEHIDQMSHLRESVSLRGYGQRNPLMEYKQEAYMMFKQLLGSIQHNVVSTFFKMQINVERPQDTMAASRIAERQVTNEQQIENNVTHSSLADTKPPAKVKEVQNVAIANPAKAPAVAKKPTPPAKKEKPGEIEVIRVGDDSPAPAEYEKVGRNDPCPCGSEKKYKKCHGKEA